MVVAPTAFEPDPSSLYTRALSESFQTASSSSASAPRQFGMQRSLSLKRLADFDLEASLVPRISSGGHAAFPPRIHPPPPPHATTSSSSPEPPVRSSPSTPRKAGASAPDESVSKTALWVVSLLSKCTGGTVLAGPAAQRDAAVHLRRIWLRLLTAAIRGAAAGATLKGGLHLLSFVLVLLARVTRRSGGSPPLVAGAAAAASLRGVSRPLPLPTVQLPVPRRDTTLTSASGDTARYALFLGTLGGVYVAVDEGLALCFGRQRSSKWRALVAGLCAGQTLHITGQGERHWSLATYVMLRGLVLLVRCGNKLPAGSWLRRLLGPTRMTHGDTALTCLASSQICYSFIMQPSTLPPSYVKFLNRQGAKDVRVWAAIRELAQRLSQGLSPGPLATLSGTPMCQHSSRRPCAFYHPGQSCMGHAAGILPHAYFRALGVYFPVYVVPALLVHRHKLIAPETAHEILPKVAYGIARSALFLTLFISLAFGSACIGFNALDSTSGVGIASTVWVGGLATLAEKKSRRMELALYTFSRAIESFARCLCEWGWVNPAHWPSRLDTCLFSFGCGAIMHAYSDDEGRHRDVFRSKYLSVLDAVFGNEGMSTGCIQHVPSNKQLLTSISLRVRSYSMGRLKDHAGNAEDLQEQLLAKVRQGAPLRRPSYLSVGSDATGDPDDLPDGESRASSSSQIVSPTPGSMRRSKTSISLRNSFSLRHASSDSDLYSSSFCEGRVHGNLQFSRDTLRPPPIDLHPGPSATIGLQRPPAPAAAAAAAARALLQQPLDLRRDSSDRCGSPAGGSPTSPPVLSPSWMNQYCR